MIIGSRISAILVLLLWANVSWAQSFDQDVQFLGHLEQISQYKEAVYYAAKATAKYQDRSQIDSLLFLKAKYHYQLKEIDLSVKNFRAVSDSSIALWQVAQFFIGFQLSYQKDYAGGRAVFCNASFTDSLYLELQKYECASASLLSRDLTAFDTQSGLFTYDYYQLADYERDMISLAGELKNHQRKSPFVAGAMSAVIPGSGKFYQGKIGQGLMALIGTGMFGLQTLEAYRKDGVESPRFIIFGSVFSVFYIANIWGSAVSVRINERRYQEDIDEAIIVNMHLPIRLLFQ